MLCKPSSILECFVTEEAQDRMCSCHPRGLTPTELTRKNKTDEEDS